MDSYCDLLLLREEHLLHAPVIDLSSVKRTEEHLRCFVASDLSLLQVPGDETEVRGVEAGVSSCACRSSSSNGLTTDEIVEDMKHLCR